MGVLTSYLIYRTGKKSGIRRTVEDLERELDRLVEPCINCTYMAMQHSQDGRARCPTYD